MRRAAAQSSSREQASMSDVGTLAAMDAFAGGARRRPARLPPPPPFVPPPPPPQRHDHYYVRRKSPVPRHTTAAQLTLFARTNGTYRVVCHCQCQPFSDDDNTLSEGPHHTLYSLFVQRLTSDPLLLTIFILIFVLSITNISRIKNTCFIFLKNQ